jgi:hypothetical protein
MLTSIFRVGDRVEHMAMRGHGYVGVVEELAQSKPLAWVRWPKDVVDGHGLKVSGFPGSPSVHDPYVRRHAQGALALYADAPPTDRTPEAIEAWLNT